MTTYEPFVDLNVAAPPVAQPGQSTQPVVPLIVPTVDSDPPSRQRIRVLHVISGEYYAGAERVQDLLAEHLPEAHCDIAFACVSADQFPIKRKCQLVPLERTPLRYPWSPHAVRTIANMIRRDGYQIIHSHTPRSAWAAARAAKMTGCPFVHTMHDVSLGQPRNLIRKVFGTYTISLLRAADVLTTVSQSTQALAERLRLGKRRQTILNGVPSARPAFHRTVPGDADGIWNLGAVGLIRPCKGIEVLIRGVGSLRDRGRPVKATVVGTFDTPEYEQSVRALVERLGLAGQINFVGFSSDVPRHLETFDLFVMPSIGPEGLPMVMLESMAHGLPTIGSSVAGVGDVVRSGIDGLIFPAGDHESLADEVERVIRGDIDWSALSSAARLRHEQEFSVQRMAEQYAGVYRGLVARAAV